jgi:hypothetical protein
MNIGEMQRLLSVKAGREPNHKFDDLYNLVCQEDWLRLAYEHVRQNAGSKTAGCDGVNIGEWESDLGVCPRKTLTESCWELVCC